LGSRNPTSKAILTQIINNVVKYCHPISFEYEYLQATPKRRRRELNEMKESSWHLPKNLEDFI
jgi:hypothetical protein